MYTQSDLEFMRSVDVQTVDRDALVDLTNTEVNRDLPCYERFQDYVSQIGNPYCFRIGELTVKNTFTEGGISLEQALAKVLLAMR